MAAINDLIKQIKDPELQERIQKEVDKLSKQKKFGLVFEEHLPECTPLYDMPVKKGCNIMLRNNKENKSVYIVLKIENGQVICAKKDNLDESISFNLSEVVRVAEFGEPIYPYLKPIDSVCNAPDSDLWHTLIEADNYHALQLLEYLYAGKVDCIYIDPPYNTGARDWKYNNDYVDGNDTYRHSKWLSMMQKRLKLAKRLLNPRDSVLIVTIDEKEYLHLGCLLEEMFPEANIQMISSVISPRGSARKNMFTRVDEYIYFVFLGDSEVIPFGPDMLQNTEYSDIDVVVWAQMIRTGTDGPRAKRPNLFYPVFFNKGTGKYVGVGDPLPKEMDRRDVHIPEDCFAVFPIRRDGLEVRWALQVETFKEKTQKGYIKFGNWKPGDTNRALAHLQSGTINRIENGDIETFGKDDEGTIILGNTSKGKRPVTIWNMQSHDAGSKGKNLLMNILPNCKFDFPKSVYATRDCLKFIVADKPTALVVDFFAGSGTTLHAVNLLNAEDGGQRRCILVTNNEVSDDEAEALSKAGHQPGDEKWEELGIAHYVTWPRTVCSIEGHDVKGNPLKGNYLGSDLPMADGFKANAAFFKLGFLDKTSVALGKQFREMLPTLWLKAGAHGKCPSMEGNVPDILILPENHFAVLINENVFSDFKDEVAKYPEIQTVYLITDYEVNYRAMKSSLAVETTYQLYRDYLDNFRINHGRN
jgi:adenine-specific DNA-methyltransferase